MLSDNFDKKIKEVLEQRAPAFDENSWLKMEKLLDKYLPQKKDDRRRWIILLFFFLLLGGGAAFLLTGKPSSELTGVISNQSVSKDNTVKKEIASVGKDQKETKPEHIYKKEDNSFTSEKEAVSKRERRGFATKTARHKDLNFNFTLLGDFVPLWQKNIPGNEDPANKNEKAGIQQETGLAITTLQQPENPKQEVKATEKETGSTETKPSSENKKTPDPVSADTKKVTSKNQKSILKSFAISFSSGPDISAVGFNNMGKLKLAYGAGIGYKISNRFSVRSGFYVGRKVYTANPGDYNPPANFWAYYPNMKQIDANCKVYEVPVNLDYHFGISKKQSWFVSAGVSSLFMKKETYNYYYKPSNSQQYVYYSRSYENKNKHYFSILDLSSGYARKISPHFTLQAEPYFKIAMGGVGYGKVKLNSGGILFTASIQPFHAGTNKKSR